VAHGGKPGVAQEVLATGDEVGDLAALGMGIEEGVGRFGVHDGVRRAPDAEEFPGHDPVADRAGVNAIASEDVGGVGLPAVREVGGHRAVDIAHGPAVLALGEEPLRVAVEDVVVAFEGAGVGVASGG